MKKNILILILMLTTAAPLLAQELFDPQLLEKIILAEQKTAAPKISFRESAVTDDYDLIYMRAYWEIDPTVYYIKGAITYYIRPVNSVITSIYFDLSDTLLFSNFVFHGDTSYNFVRAGNHIIQLNLDESIAIGQLDSITLIYEGKPPSSGFGSFTQETHNGESIIWTLSEPYGASDWFPCKNTLSDKLDSIDIFIKTPVKYHAGTAGILMSETPVEGTNDKIIHWRHRYPIVTYLIGIAVTNYAIIQHTAPLNSGKIVPIVQYLYPEDSAAYMNDTTMIIAFMQLFSDLFGDYPFLNEKYGHAQWNWGGGEEHQTMSFVLNAGLFELVAHELAHQWFGNKITCGSWQDIWLNEGFATYLSGLTYEHLLPQYWLSFKLTQQGRAFRDSTRSVFCDDTTDVARIFDGSLSYAKGSYLLHMLRWKLGDETFFNAIEVYINDPELCYGFARTEDLQQHLETIGGQDLDEFFNDWFYGKGYPTYHTKWSKLADGTVNIALHQTQNNSSVSFYEMPVPILLKDASHDTTIIIQNDVNNMTYKVGPFSFSPDSIFLDPELWLLAKKEAAVYDPMLSTLLNIFPNPATDAVTISYYGNNDAMQNITIYDVSGKKMITLSTTQVSFYNPVTIDISNLSGGYYFLEIKTSENKYVEKMVKF